MHEIQTHAKVVLNMKEFCKELRGANTEEIRKQASSTDGRLCEILSLDDFAVGKRVVADTATFSDMLSFAAKKIIEVSWLFWCFS